MTDTPNRYIKPPPEIAAELREMNTKMEAMGHLVADIFRWTRFVSGLVVGLIALYAIDKAGAHWGVEWLTFAYWFPA